MSSYKVSFLVIGSTTILFVTFAAANLVLVLIRFKSESNSVLMLDTTALKLLSEGIKFNLLFCAVVKPVVQLVLPCVVIAV